MEKSSLEENLSNFKKGKGERGCNPPSSKIPFKLLIEWLTVNCKGNDEMIDSHFQMSAKHFFLDVPQVHYTQNV